MTRCAECAADRQCWRCEKFDALQSQAAVTAWDAIRTGFDDCLTNGDTEGAHGDADDLLCVALLKTGGGAAALVRAYLAVEKWYA